MIKIGDFSKVCGVSVKTLRYYDEIDLIKPVYSGEISGYRFYEYTQLSVMLLIKRLKCYGFSLESIKKILEDRNEDTIASLLYEQKRKLKKSIADKQQTLVLLEEHIYCFERTGELMSYKKENKVEIKTVAEMKTLSIRQMMGVKDFDQVFKDLFAKVATLGATPAGIPISIYHDEEFNPENSDIEVAIPILERELANHILPAGNVVATVHMGAYDDIPEAYVACVKYIEEHGLEMISSPYEVYRTSGMDQTPAEKWETEVCFPIKGN